MITEVAEEYTGEITHLWVYICSNKFGCALNKYKIEYGVPHCTVGS